MEQRRRRALPSPADAGVAALRFDFRGVGRSEGEHDDGRAERLDVVAALDVAAPSLATARSLVAGWSFGR